MAQKEKKHSRLIKQQNKKSNNKGNYQNSISYITYKQNKIFYQNMLALQECYPEMVDMLKDLPDNHNYEILKTSTHLPTLRAKAENILYYDPIDPLKDVEKQIAALGLKNTRLAVFLGLGLGYEALYFMEKIASVQKTSYILIVEKDPHIFIAALKTVNLVPIITNRRVKLMVGVRECDLYKEFRNYLAEDSKYIFTRAMKPVYHLSALKFYKEYYLKVIRDLKESATHQILNFGNCPEDSLIGIENMLDNLDEIIKNPGINHLFGKFTGKPAIVVATGPSLNKNKHLLKGLGDKALIVSADASLKILIDMGVKPHLVTSLERMMPTVKLMEGFKVEDVEDVYYAACPVVRKEAYEIYPGPRVIVYRQFDHFKWLGIEKGMLNIQLSAGNMAFKIAESLGCDPIILIGQDLAYSRDGRTNAAGTTYGERQAGYLVQDTLEVMGNDGSPIITNKTLYSFLKGYELDVAQYQGTCINSTEGGAYINGTRVMPFQEVINKYIHESFKPLETIKLHLKKPFSAEVERDYKKVLKLIDKTAADMREIISNCREGINVYEAYKQELEQCLADPGNIENLIDKLPKIEEDILGPKRRCGKIHSTFQLFLQHVIQSFHIKFEMEVVTIPEKHDNDHLSLVEILLKQAEWYAVIGDLANICLNTLLQAKGKLIQKLGSVIIK